LGKTREDQSKIVIPAHFASFQRIAAEFQIQSQSKSLNSMTSKKNAEKLAVKRWGITLDSV